MDVGVFSTSGLQPRLILPIGFRDTTVLLDWVSLTRNWGRDGVSWESERPRI